MTEPQPPRAAGLLAEAGGLGAASDPSTFSDLTADAMRAHADCEAGALIGHDRLVRTYTAEGIEEAPSKARREKRTSASLIQCVGDEVRAVARESNFRER